MQKETLYKEVTMQHGNISIYIYKCEDVTQKK